MLAIEPNQSLLPVILLIIGLAAFVGTLISIWHNRHEMATRRAVKTSFLISLAAGLAAMAYWEILGDEPMVPLAVVAIALFVMAPTFIVAYYFSSAWYQRANAEDDPS